MRSKVNNAAERSNILFKCRLYIFPFMKYFTIENNQFHTLLFHFSSATVKKIFLLGTYSSTISLQKQKYFPLHSTGNISTTFIELGSDSSTNMER